ncbi:MAG: tRNA (adenosine(37)-N6)-dimethylallyltransferase MiaA [Clostridia bacterium]|nr:tRNA (adenosine(37)-N6)-dimethylallyltransferase MiaA [Clostridia bacterium]
MNKILIICGPTASGKTALAIECAKLLNSEVVSADSMYIYKGLNIGTAKPTTEEMNNIKHHLIDVVEPTTTFSVGDYKELAKPIIDDLLTKNKVPVICGGTGFYINSILYDLSYGNAGKNLDAREKYFNMAKELGNIAVYNELFRVDKESAEKLHPNDLKRVIRALEIYESGYKKSAQNDSLTPIYEYDAYTINHEREILYSRIDQRVDIMVNSGLVNEVNGLIDTGIDINFQCMQGIGYKEIYSYLKNEISLTEAIEKIKLNTHHYAKRQITFFKKLPNLQYLQPEDPKILAERIVNKL